MTKVKDIIAELLKLDPEKQVKFMSPGCGCCDGGFISDPEEFSIEDITSEHDGVLCFMESF